MTLRAIQAAEAAPLRALGLMTTRQPPLTRPIKLRAIRYRAVLRGWAFRPNLWAIHRGEPAPPNQFCAISAPPRGNPLRYLTIA